MADVKLGKLDPKIDQRTLQLNHYLLPTLIPVPAALDLSQHVAHWPMYENDRIGDCTEAARAHMTQLFGALEGVNRTPRDHDVIASYSRVSGYNPQTGANDNGAYELDVLNDWRKHVLAGETIYAFAQLHPDERQHVEAALYLFGGVYIGIALPQTAETQIGSTWDVVDTHLRGPAAPGSWGGHAVNIVAYDDAGLTCVTWGALQRMSWAFWSAYVDEAYALLPSSWKKHSPISGFDFAALQQDLQQIAS